MFGRRTDRELAATRYAGRESASERAARLQAYREQRATERQRRAALRR
jgi:hypothetical protein